MVKSNSLSNEVDKTIKNFPVDKPSTKKRRVDVKGRFLYSILV